MCSCGRCLSRIAKEIPCPNRSASRFPARYHRGRDRRGGRRAQERMDHHGPENQAARARAGRLLGHAARSLPGVGHGGARVRLRALGIGPGDEVITSAYTYTASCSPICHVGATPVLCDVAPDSYEMDYAQLERLITPRTKAIIPVDLARPSCATTTPLFAAIDARRRRAARPQTTRQQAHRRASPWSPTGRMRSAACAMASASRLRLPTSPRSAFHAVKNFTTAEGGAARLARRRLFDSDELYHAVHAHVATRPDQRRACRRPSAGAWEYDVAFPGWKCNMTDLQAALGLAQLRRYPGMLARRRQMVARYTQNLADLDLSILQHYRAADGSDACNADDAAARADASQESSSGHLMLVRLNAWQGGSCATALIELHGRATALPPTCTTSPCRVLTRLPRPRLRHRRLPQRPAPSSRTRSPCRCTRKLSR